MQPTAQWLYIEAAASSVSISMDSALAEAPGYPQHLGWRAPGCASALPPAALQASYKVMWFLAFLVPPTPLMLEKIMHEGWVRWILNDAIHLYNKQSLSNYYESNAVLCARH